MRRQCRMLIFLLLPVRNFRLMLFLKSYPKAVNESLIAAIILGPRRGRFYDDNGNAL